MVGHFIKVGFRIKWRWLVWLAFPCAAVEVAAATPSPLTYQIQTVAGSGHNGDGGPAVAAEIGNIQGLTFDAFGNLYLTDTDHHRVRKISPAGIITTFAGTGSAGFSGDGGPAPAAQLNLPYGLAADSTGDIYIADLGNNRVRRVGPDGMISTFAGGGQGASIGDGGPAPSAQLLAPRNIALDGSGNVYISEFSGHRIRRVAPDGTVSTVAGTGAAGFSGDGGPAQLAQLAFPAGLAVDSLGGVYVADSQNQRIRRFVSGGVINTLLGGASATELLTPVAVRASAVGALYVGDNSGVVHVFTVAGHWSNFAGDGQTGFAGDGGPATAAQITAARDLALDAEGDVYIADGVRIREVDLAGVIGTIAGDAYQHAIGDGGPALSAVLSGPSAVALDSSGNLYIADPGTERVRKVSSVGLITTLAGTGIVGYVADEVPASSAPLNSPMGVAVDMWDEVFIADSSNQRVRDVGADGIIRAFAGDGVGGAGPEGAPPQQTALNGPRGVCVGAAGAVFIADTSNDRVLRVPPGTSVLSAAGNGIKGNTGDGGPASLAELNQPVACAADTAGDLFIADTGNHTIRKITPGGTIYTVAGSGSAGLSGDEGPAVAAQLRGPQGVAVDDNGDIFIADTGNNSIRQVTPDGIIHTIAGQAAVGFAGDGGPATSALLDGPQGLVLDGSGNLYFADTNNNRVRQLLPQAAAPVTPGAPPTPPAVSAVNAASLVAGPVAPGEILVINGTGIGPPESVTGVYDSNGMLPTEAGGAQVLFDDAAAPLLSAQANQVTVQAPYSIAGSQSTNMAVQYGGDLTGSATLAVATAAPGLFPLATNEDGSTNSSAAPAPRGSIVTFYGTGEGLTSGPNIAGLAAQAYAAPLLPVLLTVAGVTAETTYVGSAPGLVGTLQINARIPGGFVPPGEVAVVLTVGEALSPPIQIWVQ